MSSGNIISRKAAHLLGLQPAGEIEINLLNCNWDSHCMSIFVIIIRMIHEDAQPHVLIVHVMYIISLYSYNM